MLDNSTSGAQAYALCVSRLHGWLIGSFICFMLRLLAQEISSKRSILSYGRVCLYWAKASVHSTLYWHYKHLVPALQASCTGATSILYWHYKHLVQTLQASCSVCAKRFSLHCKRCCADTLLAKWGVRTMFYNQSLLMINAPTGCCAVFLDMFIVRHLLSQVHVSCRIAAS